MFVNLQLIGHTPTVNIFQLEILRVQTIPKLLHWVVCTVKILLSSGYEKVQLAQSTQFRRLQRACNEKMFYLLGSLTKRACNAQFVLPASL